MRSLDPVKAKPIQNGRAFLLGGGATLNTTVHTKQLNVAVVGLGMIGGSVAVGLKNYVRPCPRIVALDHNLNSLRAAVQQGVADCILPEAGPQLEQADVIFLCTPVLQLEVVAAAIAPFLKAGAIVTDVGSTKGWVAPRMRQLLPPNVHYIGGHPMAGREKSGYSAADGNLFKDKWYILCPDSDTDQQSLTLVRALVESLGAKVAVMDAQLHDQCAAVISHTPHIAAAAMVNLLDCYPDPQTSLQLAGGGFRDTTRIASSDADMWADVCISNAPAILHSLEAFQGIISDLSDAVKASNREAIHAFFRSAKERRDGLLQRLEAKP